MDTLPILSSKSKIVQARQTFLGKIMTEFFLINLSAYLKASKMRKMKVFIETFNKTAQSELPKIFGQKELFESYKPLAYDTKLHQSLRMSSIRDFFYTIFKSPKMEDEELTEDQQQKQNALMVVLNDQADESELNENSLRAACRMTEIPRKEARRLITLAKWRAWAGEKK